MRRLTAALAAGFLLLAPIARAEEAEANAAPAAALERGGAFVSREDTPLFPTEHARARTAAPAKEPIESAGSVLARISFYFILLLGLLVAGIVGLKRFLPGGKKIFGSPAMELVGRTYLDGKRYVALLRVGARVLVLGAGPEGVESLGEITDPAEVADLLRDARPATEAGRSAFRALLQGSLTRQETQERAVASGGEAARLAREVEGIESNLRRLRSTT